MMTYFDHSVTRHMIYCRFTLAELEFLVHIVTNLFASAHGSHCFATNDNDRPREERMRVKYSNLLDELTADLKELQKRVKDMESDPAVAVLNALGG